MQQRLKFLLILAIGIFGLTACGTLGAGNQAVQNSSSPPPPEITKTSGQAAPEKPPKAAENIEGNSSEDLKNSSVKDEDRDKTAKDDNSLCNVEGYVVDKDPNGLNIRQEGGVSAKIIGKIPFDEEGTIVHITGANYAGWLTIDRAENRSGKKVFSGKGWVSGNMLATSTRGYGTNGVKLYETDGGAKILTVIPAEEVVKIDACNGTFVRITYKKFNGWLDSEAQCPNPMTNCS